ncbi:MAG: type II toxin-antitoxin system HicB family antitoxin [Acidimicrobiales bacterium]
MENVRVTVGREDGQHTVVLVNQPEGGYVVSVVGLPGVVTEGDTYGEALAMAQDAIEGYLEVMRARGWPPVADTAVPDRRSRAIRSEQTRAKLLEAGLALIREEPTDHHFDNQAPTPLR